MTLHGEEQFAFGDAGYQGLAKRPEATSGVVWHTARRPKSRKPFEREGKLGRIIDKREHLKASVRAKVEHPFPVIKRQFGHVKVRYRGLAKNTAQLHTLFAVSNMWMARRKLIDMHSGTSCDTTSEVAPVTSLSVRIRFDATPIEIRSRPANGSRTYG